ncbi:unnamed protein product [Toxocara canis]|uniref:Uncharacterized protein n=1 Tax=Toxocara canis TaxID=6265 RepID=A0A183UEI8_TOXCA|nr:unnamed protein product [Toxocara canis]
MRVVLLLIAVHYGTASICPQVNHTVCNSDHPQHACVCGISLKEEAPPEKSCNKLLKIEKNNFPATSVIFKLDEHSDHHDIFPEKKFREAVATSLRIDQLVKVESFIDEEEEEMNEQENEFSEEQEEDSNNEGTVEIEYDEEEEERRRKARRQRKNQTPKMYNSGDVLRAAEVVHKMIDIEGEPNNTVLVVQTVLAGVAFGMMCILGVWRGLKKKEDLYESVEQKV